MAGFKRDVTRLTLILKRQAGQRFGADYQPAQQATVAEAPSRSRASIVASAKLGRGVHLLSHPETHPTFLALYHPQLFDLHEQRMLSTGPAVHPLFGHPKAVGMQLPPLPGTVRVLADLGKLNKHPIVLYKPSPDPRTWERLPFPYLADLLLFLEDDAGPYCVNWTVKNDPEEFKRRGGYNGKPVRRGVRVDPSVTLRHELEALHYAAGGIRTVQITPERFDMEVINNLRRLFLFHARKLRVDDSVRRAVIQMFAQVIGTPTRTFEVSRAAMSDMDLTLDVVDTIRNQAIWNRELRVDLFSALLSDQPLRPETVDVCVHYRHLFAREVA